MHELLMPKILKRRKDLHRRSGKCLIVGFHLEWMWTHGCVPHASGLRRKVRVEGPDDITEGDVNLPERSMPPWLRAITVLWASEGKEIEISEVRD
jgi:hypothetical protein